MDGIQTEMTSHKHGNVEAACGMAKVGIICLHLWQVYLVSRHIPDRTQRWRWRSCFAVQQQKCFIKFWAINKTKVQKIYVEVEVYGLNRGRTSAQVKTLRPFFSTLSTTKVQNLSKYQVLLFRGIFQLSKLHFDDLGPGI